MLWYANSEVRVNGKDQTIEINLKEYVNGRLPKAGRPWMTCNYLLIPCSYPSNNWYLFHINIREWKFQIYDCSNSPHTPEEVKAHVIATQGLVQKLLFFSVSKSDIRKYI